MTDVLTIYDRQAHDVFGIIDRSALAASTKTKYRRVVEAYMATGGRLTDRRALAEFAGTLSHSRRAQLKAAVKLWSAEKIQELQAEATPENVRTVDAAIHRLSSLTTGISTAQPRGKKAHIWLSRSEIMRLMDAARSTGGNIGLRDQVALGLLVGAGLRRSEAVSLRFADIAEQPVGEKRRAVLQVAGKGAKHRLVPISPKLAGLLEAWKTRAGEGLVLRSVDRLGSIGESLSAPALFQIVRAYGAEIGHPTLAAHDLRRSYAQAGLEAGVPLPQISALLGHASLSTTQKYLDLSVDLSSTISDFIPL